MGYRLALLGLLVSACSSTPTQVVVLIDADDDVRAAALEVRLQVFAEGDSGELSDRVFLASRGVSGWPMQHVVTPRDGDATRRYRLVATAVDAGFSIVSEARLDSTYLDGRVGEVRLTLRGGPCFEQTCTDDRTCDPQADPVCVPIPSVDPLPRGTDPGRPDASDAGDAGPDSDGGDCDAGAGCTVEDQGPCAVGRIECEGGVEICVAEPAEAGTSCRAIDDTNPCDAEDTCDGESFVCPDNFAVEGSVCGDPDALTFCFSGDCRECVQDSACEDPDNPCRVGQRDCSTVPATCTGFVDAPETTVCRTAAGPCDIAETCVSGSCPTDAFIGAGELVCRPTVDPSCGLPESCDGLSAACPPDRHRPATVVCLESGAPCQDGSNCTGESEVCPPRSPTAEGTTCRASVGECDSAEACDGENLACPANGYVMFGTECAGADTICNGAGACVPPDCDGDGECALANECMIGRIVCTGTTSECVADRPVSDGTPCGEPRRSDEVCLVNRACQGGACVENFLDGDCGPAPTEGSCVGQAECGESPFCPEPPEVPLGDPCGEETECDARVCQREGSDGPLECVRVTARDGVPCGDPSISACDRADQCESGVCDERPSNAGRSCVGVTPPECHRATCDGDGACDIEPLSNGRCAGGSCEDGECQTAVIGEIAGQLDGMGTGYLELYNPGNEAVPLDGCSLRVESAMDVTQEFVTTDAIPPHGHFLVGLLAAAADKRVNLHIDPSSGTATFRCGSSASAEPIDAVAWGDALSVEGDPLGPLDDSTTWERKACLSSTALQLAPGGIHNFFGNSVDTDDNRSDFVNQRAPTLNNRASPNEEPMCVTSGDT